MLLLACGHVLSNLLRTLPALAIDVMGRDLETETLARLTSVYHLAFAAGQLVVGIALERLSVKTASLILLCDTIIESAGAALAEGPGTLLIAQAVLGLGTSGMLLRPFALGAQLLPPPQFPLWTGITPGLGNTGMLLQTSPLARLIGNFGWRSALLLWLVPGRRPLGEVLRLACSRSLRGIIILDFASLAVVLVTRGPWAGPWLMEVKGATRTQAGHGLLPFTPVLIAAPEFSRAFSRPASAITAGSGKPWPHRRHGYRGRRAGRPSTSPCRARPRQSARTACPDRPRPAPQTVGHGAQARRVRAFEPRADGPAGEPAPSSSISSGAGIDVARTYAAKSIGQILGRDLGPAGFAVVPRR